MTGMEMVMQAIDDFCYYHNLSYRKFGILCGDDVGAKTGPVGAQLSYLRNKKRYWISSSTLIRVANIIDFDLNNLKGHDFPIRRKKQK